MQITNIISNKSLLLNVIGFNEAVIMDRDVLFKEIDSHLLNGIQEKYNKIEAVISSYSKQKFLGFCTLAKNRMLEMKQTDKDRC